jgi:hypothetical protein
MLGCAQKQVNVGDEPINSWIVGYTEVIPKPTGLRMESKQTVAALG